MAKDEATPLVHDGHPDPPPMASPPRRLLAAIFGEGRVGSEDEDEPPLQRHERHVSFDTSLDGDANGDPLAEVEESPRRRRGHSRGDSLVDIAMESISEVKEVIVDTFEEVKETITEGIVEIQEVLEEEIATPIKPREEGDHSQKLSTLALAVLVFYKVSGGPFGCEPSVKAGGPFFAILGFTIMPIIWCIPEALITAELGSAYPEPSGAIAWVEEAFGPKAGLLCGYFHWVSGATDNAIYPSLFLAYIADYIGHDFSSNLMRFLFTVAITTVLSFVNWTGLEIVGNLSIVVCIISMSPFIILCLMAIPRLDVSRWLVMPEAGIELDDDYSGGFLPEPTFGGVMWRPLLNSLFWNLNSFDVGASFAGEVRDPERVFPRAMFLSIVFVSVSYLLPIMAAIGAVDTDQADWNAGYFTTLSTKIGGPWLGAWTVFAAAISNIALFEAEMSGDAYQLMGMADRGLIPKLFTKRSRFDTPQNGILLGTVVIFAMSMADFDALVEMLNFAYSLSMFMELGAFVKLRISDPDVERPYRVPLNTFGCILFIIPPCIFLVYLIVVASKMTYIYFSLLSIFGLGFHFVQKVVKHYKLVEYVKAPKRIKKKKPTPPTVPVVPTETDPLLATST